MTIEILFALTLFNFKKFLKLIDINTSLIEGYLQMLDNLSPNNKLDLISKLSLTIKGNDKVNNKAFYEAFGAWDSNQSAEDIINDIRKSRQF
jgi:hypothetical protein